MSRILHTVNKSASAPALDLAKCALAENDALLFIENGVNAIIENSLSAKALEPLSQNHSLYCLKADIQARGLSRMVPEWVQVIDYDGFVQLTEQHTKTLSWF
ncbi:sulfurtransferase complex subunit TusB [Sansalvadorimonas sp. 2012CJ34-2]|uniref:Sulfurtransferase complex subunit TusB n=1 Tax=Parendozoicomonas callyspongiae TaxID=2942213 RepID=A0ABT0PBQ8_9GAMM|nr:sulfurtransferase complex subunit TusB [Sansalvadorimonas sp. 2012CJ34-2]MCL6268805.1 sulfurtransferase complex subunit TusB [Sansalvadorimonas sp. 2012CJ34-2]